MNVRVCAEHRVEFSLPASCYLCQAIHLLEPWDDMRRVDFDSNDNVILRISGKEWKAIRRLLGALRGD